MSFDFTETLTITVPDVEEQVAAFQESDYQKTHGLIIEVAAIHEGMTANYNFYPAKALEESLSSWVKPYPKPIIMNHDPTSEPVGRVMAAKMEKEDDGTPYVMLRVAITDPEAIAKVSDQRYLTGSVGGSAKQANCSVCGADWAEASIRNIPCKHQRGKTYKGKLAYMEMNGIGFKEYSFVNMPADQHSGIRAMHTAAEGEIQDEDTWVKAAKIYSLNMDNEEILEFSESEQSLNILEEKSKKEASWMYAQFKGSFLSALIAESESGEDSKKPYGDVKYADPGYQSDSVKRYPIDTKDHVRAAWSYINQRKNASKYTSDQLKQIKGRIRTAAKKFGIELGNEEFDVSTEIINEEEEDILAVAEGLSSDLAEPTDVEEEEASAEEGEEEESVEEEEEAVATDEENSTEEEVKEEEEEEISEEAVASEEEEPAEEAEKPEGQESPREKDIDPEDSSGAPVSRENDDEEVVNAEEGEKEEEVTEEEEETETDLNESIATLESRVEELETREQTLLEENAKLKAALKRNLAERVVDTKVALGFVKPDAREAELEEHAKRSASSLADSLRDLAGMSRSSDIQLPQVNNESASIDEDDNSFVIDDVDEPEEKEDELDPEDVFVDALMGRRKL